MYSSFAKLIEIIVFTHTDKPGFVPFFSELTVEDDTTDIIQTVCSNDVVMNPRRF